MATRTALVGAGGYGLHHRRAMTPLQDAGRIELVGLCDVQPIRDEPGAPVPASAMLTDDHEELLTSTRPDVVVVATPPHTHATIATAAAQVGADVLLEKPPFPSIAEHRAFAKVLGDTGRRCQVGFQALGSAALTELTTEIRSGKLGRVTGIGAYGAWQRPDSYYDRAPWAGRRVVDGRPVLDGALVNPFAHAVMQSLAVAGALGPVSLANVELDRYRARDIEVDDTSAMRVRLTSGLVIVVAVTLAADDHSDPEIIVHGERGTAVLSYTTDRLSLPGEASDRLVPGRTGLLENLLDHRAEPDAVPLVAPLERTAPFTELVEANTAAGPPAPIADRHLAAIGTGTGTGTERIVTIPGVTNLLREAGEKLALPSELGAPWTTRGWEDV